MEFCDAFVPCTQGTQLNRHPLWAARCETCNAKKCQRKPYARESPAGGRYHNYLPQGSWKPFRTFVNAINVNRTNGQSHDKQENKISVIHCYLEGKGSKRISVRVLFYCSWVFFSRGSVVLVVDFLGFCQFGTCCWNAVRVEKVDCNRREKRVQCRRE